MLNEIYENVGTVASSYQVEIAEARCSSFVLVCDDAADPASSGSFCEFQQDQPIITSLVRLLSLVIDLHRRLQLTQAQHGGLWLSMGIASGSVTLLGCGSGAAWSPWTALPVRDDAAQLAEEMAAAAAGDRSAVAVHESALWRWAAAAREMPPPSDWVHVHSGGRRRAAVFDLRDGEFRQPRADAAGVGAPPRLRRAASCTR